jgi:polyhydroxyalkanoate synthase
LAARTKKKVAGTRRKAKARRASETPERPSSKDPRLSETERALRAQLAALSGGLAPDDYVKAWWDWYLHLAGRTDRQAELAHSAYEKTLDSFQFVTRAASGEPLAPGREDLGFGAGGWHVWPFNS